MKRKSLFHGSRWCFISLISVILAACGGGGGSDSGFDVAKYDEPVYLIGSLGSSPLGNVLKAAFPKMADYKGQLKSSPLFLTADQLEEPLSESIVAALDEARKTYRPIVLIGATTKQINVILAQIGEPADYALPEGLDESIKNPEIFAIDFEEDGMISKWDIFSPAALRNEANETIWEDYDDFRVRRVDLLVEWIAADGKRSEKLAGGRENAKQAIAAQSADNLINLSPAYMTIRSFAYRNDLFQITHNTWTCHSFSESDGVDYDWLYVEQSAQLRSGGDYRRRTDHKFFPSQAVFGNDYEIVENYVTDYWTYSAFDDHSESKSYVNLLDSSPKNANNVTSVTDGISYNFGGSIGFQGKTPEASLSAGLTISNSTTYNVTDATVENQSLSGTGHDARWKFIFKLPEGYRTGIYPTFHLADPAFLSRSLFQPSMSWLWRIDPRQRDIESRFHTQFGVNYGWAEGCNGTWGYPSQYYHSSAYSWWGYRVSYKNPPLIVVPTDLDFNNTGSYKTVDIAVARDWGASCDQSWCYVTPESGTRDRTRINVTVDPNTTGADRTAIVTAKTADGKDKMTMTVFQSRY